MPDGWLESPVLGRFEGAAGIRDFAQRTVRSPESKKLFVEITRPIYKQFEPSIGKDFLDLAVKELG